GGTPKARVERLGAALQQVLADPQMRAQIEKQGLNPEPSTPDEFAKLIRTEMVKWAKVMKAAGIQPE
ncbi:MAG TPA: tripartite tricarboxylate transporter substrate-binding protein, partial [Burkholderiales bacterium]|nr:tripartite tricarboxylate transporter substrate-binding protein [Burkholderiales bacterium]